jgi:hypothetical protein
VTEAMKNINPDVSPEQIKERFNAAVNYESAAGAEKKAEQEKKEKQVYSTQVDLNILET